MELIWGIVSLTICAGFVSLWLQAARFPGDVWLMSGHNRELWLAGLILIPVVWIPYLVFVRPKLLRFPSNRPAS